MYDPIPDAPWVRDAETNGMPDTTDAWERDEPDWLTVCELVETWMSEDVPDIVRDYLDGDGDLMWEIYEAGLIDDYIDPAKRMKDLDECWNEVDRIFCREWDNDALMRTIWDWMPEEHVRKAIEAMMRNADHNGLRYEYNKRMGA